MSTIDLGLPGMSRPVKSNTFSRAFLCGYQWKSASDLDVHLRSVRVKLKLAQGASGYAMVMSRSGDRIVKGSLFPAEAVANATNQHTSPTVGLRKYESHFSAAEAPRLSRGCYILVAVRGHGSVWLGVDGGPLHGSFRAVPAPAGSTVRIAPRGGGGSSSSPRKGGGGATAAMRWKNDRRRKDAAVKSQGHIAVSDGSNLGAKVRSVFIKSGQPLAPAAVEDFVPSPSIALTVTYGKKAVTRMVDAAALASEDAVSLFSPGSLASSSVATPPPPPPPARA